MTDEILDLSYQIHVALEMAGVSVLSVSDADGTRNGIRITLSDESQRDQAEPIADSFFG